MRHLGIDYGSKRIGLALSDEAGDFAFPYAVIDNGRRTLKQLEEICKKEGVAKIVMGESLDYQGKPNVIMPAIHKLAKSLKEETGLPVEFEKEFMTSAEAARLQGANEKIDASAAALILKSYLERKKFLEEQRT